jgi:hypothetical protein
MNLRAFGCAVAMLVEGTRAAQLPVETAIAPQVDHHQHLLSPKLAAAWSEQLVTADRLIAQLDSAGIRRALVLSLAYAHGSPSIRGDDEYAQVRGENDWTSQQVARYPGRLRAFCSFNPLRDYALAELDRCAKDPNLRYGVKLHFASSGRVRGRHLGRRPAYTEPLLRRHNERDGPDFGRGRRLHRRPPSTDRTPAHPLRIRHGHCGESAGPGDLGSVSGDAAPNGRRVRNHPRQRRAVHALSRIRAAVATAAVGQRCVPGWAHHSTPACTSGSTRAGLRLRAHASPGAAPSSRRLMYAASPRRDLKVVSGARL